MGGGNTPPTLRRNMLLSELITELQYRVEDDSANSRYPEEQKINAINSAYYTLLSIISDKDLSKFKLTKTDLDLVIDPDSGFLYKRISDNAPLRIANGRDRRNNRECKIVNKDELFSSSPNYKYGTLVSLCKNYQYGLDFTTIYATPISASRVIIWHVQEVEGMGTGSEFPIFDTLKPVLLGIAESELWRADNDSGRAKEAYAEAINILQAQEGK